MLSPTSSMNTSAQKTKIIFAGCGNMGGAYALPMANNQANELVLVDENNYDRLKEKYKNYPNVNVFKTLGDAKAELSSADYFVAAVKPQDSAEMFGQARPHLNPKAIGISIMAGANSEYLTEASGLEYFVRAMPNMPCALGQGMTTIYIPEDIAGDKQKQVFSLLASPTIGKAQCVDSDLMVDAGTAVSGSGPAYVYVFVQYAMKKLGMNETEVIGRMDELMTADHWPQDEFSAMFKRFIDEMNKGAQAVGFGTEQAEEQVDQTIRGGIVALQQPDRDPIDTMITKVQSKGGTTIAACEVMLKEGTDFLDQIVAGMDAAFKRGQEMGREILEKFQQSKTHEVLIENLPMND